MQIQKGDTVQCIDSTNVSSLVEGQLYKVVETHRDNVREYVMVEGRDMYLAAARFQKAAPVLEDVVFNSHEIHLVVLRHAMDDFPLRLFKLEAMARAFAQQQTGDVPEEISESLGVFWPEAATPLQVGFVTFRYGSPVRYTLVKEFTDDPET